MFIDYKIRDNLEYPNHQKYGTIANGVGENPLNGNGVLLTGNAEDEDIVYSYKKFVRCVVI